VIDRPGNRALRQARFKLIVEPDGRRHGSPPPGGVSLYDLTNDPDERRDLLGLGAAAASEASRTAFARLRAEADRRAAGPRVEAERTELDPATRERLEALGYLE
jgi:hypothetical protein